MCKLVKTANSTRSTARLVFQRLQKRGANRISHGFRLSDRQAGDLQVALFWHSDQMGEDERIRWLSGFHLAQDHQTRLKVLGDKLQISKRPVCEEHGGVSDHPVVAHRFTREGNNKRVG